MEGQTPIRLFQSDEIECMTNTEGCLGSGSYGVVRLGFHRIHGTVALKCSVMRGGSRKINQLERKIRSEIELVQQAHHENIVRVYGWTQWPGAIAIVMEYLPGGNLMEALEDDDVTINPLLRLRMCYEIANGIAFIHNLTPEKRLVHGDIKAENILLNEDLHCKLADFGGARLSSYTGGSTTTNHRKHANQYTELYASPEVLERPTCKLKPSHDTYSFSVTIYVVIGRKLPSFSEAQMYVYLESVKKGDRLELEPINEIIHELEEGDINDAVVIKLLKELMIECWNPDPSARPLMVDVKNGLYELLARQDSVKIQQHAVDAVRDLEIKTFARGQQECFPLHHFSAPDFVYSPDGASNASNPNATVNNATVDVD